MSTSRCPVSPRHVLLALLVAGACAEEPPTAVQPVTLEGPPDLEVALPLVPRDRLVALGTLWTRPGGPARNESEDYPTPEELLWETGVVDPVNAVAAIWDQETHASFVPGYLSAWGDHKYQGNKGRVEVTGTVQADGRDIGSQTAATENSFPFLIDFGLPHYIWAAVRIFTDQECGLTGHGESRHKAWWEAVAGAPVASFSAVEVTSASDLARQPECPPPPPPDLGGGGGGGGSDEMLTCWYALEYDLETLEIYNAELLWCGQGG